MSLAMHHMIAQAEIMGEDYKRALARVSTPESLAEDLPSFIEDISVPLAEVMAADDAEAAGVILIAAWQAYCHRIATAVAFGTEGIGQMQTEKDAADNALGQLVLRRYRASKA